MSETILPDATSPDAQKKVRAWDLPTRLFHWTLVFCVFSAWLSFELAPRIGDPTLIWHRWNGYAILVLLVFRLIWGFVGGSTARFSAFVRWPWTAFAYLRDSFAGKARPFLGHNPAGAWMVLALLGVVGAQAILGLYTLEHNEIAAGPLQRTIMDDEALTKTIQWLHARGFYVLLALVCVHVTVNALSMKGLIPAMVTGRKKAERFEDQPELTGGSPLLALACLAAAVVIVFGTITLMGGRIL